MNTNSFAKRILCFGDSLTWGYTPGTDHERYTTDKRWSGILQIKLGAEYEAIEEGLSGRTLISEDTRPGKEGRIGSNYLIPCLDSHDPLDIVIFMLGTNELKNTSKISPLELEKILQEQFIEVILNRKYAFRQTAPELILIAPPALNLDQDYAKERYAGGIVLSSDLTQIYKNLAQAYKLKLIIASEFVSPGSDGVHLSEDANLILAQQIFKVLQS